MALVNGSVDLHIHSSASDGLYNPAEVVALASQAGLQALALTDHDTLSGLDEAEAAARQCGIEFVPGVELTTYAGEQELHILGYYPANRAILEEALIALRRERYLRMEKMVARLREAGFPVTMAAVLGEAAPAAPGRLHLARVLVKQKMIGSLEEAFSRYLERGKPAYVPRRTFRPEEALALLRAAGAIPVFAHPGQSGAAYLEPLIDSGLKGVEVYHPDHGKKLQSYYRRRAQELNLLITGGSDFHGDPGHRAQRPGSCSVPYSCLSLLKEHRH